MSDSPWGTPQIHARQAGVADDIDFEIKGQELQFVEIELDPGESAVAEAGAMVWKDASVEMTTVFGNGAGQEGGFMGKLLGAGKRLVTGESLFTTVFTHNGSGKARVAFGAPVPGAILPIRLADLGGTLICQKDSFLAAAKGVVDRHPLPARDPDRPVRRRGLHHAEARGRRLGVRPDGRHRDRARAARPARSSTSTPAASPPSRRASTST